MIFLIFILITLIESLFFSLIPLESDARAILVILVNVVIVTFFLLNKVESKYSYLIIIGLFLRITLMFADIYGWFPILHSGADSVKFHLIALQNQSQIVQRVSTNYTTWLTFVYSISDSSRIIAQYINVMFGCGIVYLIYQITKLFRIKDSTRKFVIIVAVFMPQLIIFSGILLREAWVSFFIVASVYYFFQWYIKCNALNIALVIITILIAAAMHSGALMVLAGYSIAIITYSPAHKKITIDLTAIFKLTIIVIIIVSFFTSDYSEIFTEKFASLENEDYFIDRVNNINSGGSAYLQWINVNSTTQGLLFSPLKMFYFLYSPVPFDWRGVGDIVAFFLDSVMYIYFSIIIFRNYRKIRNREQKIIINYLLLSIIAIVFTFSYGTYNSGTAIRHRAKIFPIILICYAITTINKPKKNEYHKV